MGVRDRSKVEIDSYFLIVLSEGVVGELRAIVSDDAVRDSKVANNSMDELDLSARSYLGDGHGFGPLCELVDGDEEIIIAPSYSGEWSQDIQHPDGEGPQEGNGLEGLSRLMDLLGVELASLTESDLLHGILKSSWLVETLPECFPNQHA